jgi:hypothetical protein
VRSTGRIVTNAGFSIGATSAPEAPPRTCRHTRYAQGEPDREAVARAQAAVRPSRRTVRYYDQLFWDA